MFSRQATFVKSERNSGLIYRTPAVKGDKAKRRVLGWFQAKVKEIVLT